jgi:hypothetical protein
MSEGGENDPFAKPLYWLTRIARYGWIPSKPSALTAVALECDPLAHQSQRIRPCLILA